MKQLLVSWGVRSGKAGTLSVLVTLISQGLVSGTGSATTHQKDESGTTAHMERSIRKGDPFFFYVVRWFSRRAGEGPLP